VQSWAPDDGRKYRPKHVERFTRINNLRNRSICWFYYRNILLCTDLWTSNNLKFWTSMYSILLLYVHANILLECGYKINDRTVGWIPTPVLIFLIETPLQYNTKQVFTFSGSCIVISLRNKVVFLTQPSNNERISVWRMCGLRQIAVPWKIYVVWLTKYIFFKILTFFYTSWIFFFCAPCICVTRNLKETVNLYPTNVENLASS
jgi:hypothetical protein